MARPRAFVYVNIDQVVMTHTHKHTVDVQYSEMMFRILNSWQMCVLGRTGFIEN